MEGDNVCTWKKLEGRGEGLGIIKTQIFKFSYEAYI